MDHKIIIQKNFHYCRHGEAKLEKPQIKELASLEVEEAKSEEGISSADYTNKPDDP
jgi:hypothetical protein